MTNQVLFATQSAQAGAAPRLSSRSLVWLTLVAIAWAAIASALALTNAQKARRADDRNRVMAADQRQILWQIDFRSEILNNLGSSCARDRQAAFRAAATLDYLPKNCEISIAQLGLEVFRAAMDQQVAGPEDRALQESVRNHVRALYAADKDPNYLEFFIDDALRHPLRPTSRSEVTGLVRDVGYSDAAIVLRPQRY
jgi:hypothetical protein